MDEQPIGRRVAYWRNRRKMSQQLFADRLGKSKSWVDKVERGVRRLDRFSVIYEIADVLQLDVQVLLGRDPVRRPDSVNCIDQVEVAEIRSAMERYDKISAFFFAPPEAPALTELQQGRRPRLDHLPALQVRRAGPDAAEAAARRPGRQRRLLRRRRAPGRASLLGQVYQIASSTLRKLGEHDLAWLAADRAIMVCHRAEDDLLSCMATIRVANALAALGRFRPALEINVNIANQIAPGRRAGTRPRSGCRSTASCCCRERWPLPGSATRRRCGSSSAAPRTRPSRSVATRTTSGPTSDRPMWPSTGSPPTSRWARAGGPSRPTRRIAPEDFGAMMPERRAHHLLDLSRGLAQTGDIARASETLHRGRPPRPERGPVPADRARAGRRTLRRTSGHRRRRRRGTGRPNGTFGLIGPRAGCGD